MELTKTAGGIVLGDNGTIAMVKSKNGHAWLFPKGRIEEGETEEEAARREIAEETGLTNLELIDDLGEFTRPRVFYDGAWHGGKQVRMFLFAAKPHAVLSPTLEIEEAKWVPLKLAIDTLGSPHQERFAADRAWFVSVFERVRLAVQRD